MRELLCYSQRCFSQRFFARCALAHERGGIAFDLAHGLAVINVLAAGRACLILDRGNGVILTAIIARQVLANPFALRASARWAVRDLNRRSHDQGTRNGDSKQVRYQTEFGNERRPLDFSVLHFSVFAFNQPTSSSHKSQSRRGTRRAARARR